MNLYTTNLLIALLLPLMGCKSPDLNETKASLKIENETVILSNSKVGKHFKQIESTKTISVSIITLVEIIKDENEVEYGRQASSLGNILIQNNLDLKIKLLDPDNYEAVDSEIEYDPNFQFIFSDTTQKLFMLLDSSKQIVSFINEDGQFLYSISNVLIQELYEQMNKLEKSINHE